jgi:hypothetical protein
LPTAQSRVRCGALGKSHSDFSVQIPYGRGHCRCSEFAQQARFCDSLRSSGYRFGPPRNGLFAQKKDAWASPPDPSR